MTLQPRPVESGDTQRLGPRPLQCQSEAARFATTREDAEQTAGHIRRNGHAEAIALLVDGQPGRAHAVVMRTWARQLRVLGLSYAGIPGRPYEEGGDLSW